MVIERLLSEYVPWRDYFGSDVVSLPGGAVFMMFEVDGLPFETTSDAVLIQRHAQLEHAVRDAAQDGLIYHYLECRGVADVNIYPKGQLRTAFSRGLDQAYRAKLFDGRLMWLNRTYLAIQISPHMIGGRSINKWIPNFRAKNIDPPAARVARLRNLAAIFIEHLKDYRPRALGIDWRDGMPFSQIAEAVAFAMTGYWREVPLTLSGASAVFSEKFIVGHNAFEVRMPHGATFGACLNMHDYPYKTKRSGMFDRFLTASYRHTVFHGFRCMPSIDGQEMLSRKQNTMKKAGDRALEQAAELTTAANLVAGNRMMMGDHAFALTMFCDDPALLPNVVQSAWGDLSGAGIKVEREDVALEAVLFSMIPGNFHLRGREAAISSRNFASFASMRNFSGGERKGFWGDPICMFRNAGGGPFLFHFQAAGSGNMFITGKTRSGKTSLMAYLLSQAERADATCIVWDKDRGLEAFIRAVEGTYLSLTNVPGLGSGLAPLKRLTNSPEDLTFLSSLIRACVSTPKEYEFTPEEDRRLGIALRHVMALPPEKRCMAEIRAFLGTARDGAGARLEKWCAGGEFGWVIDCEKDIVDLTNKVTAFDQSSVLDDLIAAGAIMATLFHYTGKLVDGRRLLFVLDEVWNALRIPQFHGMIRNGLATWGKYNAPILIGTQSPRDGLDSPIAHVIREQCSQIHFGNPNAVWADFGPNGMNRTEKEFDIIKKLTLGTGHFLLCQEDRSNVLQCPLGGFSEIRVMSGTRRGLDALAVARKRTDDATGPVLVAAYHEALAEELAA